MQKPENQKKTNNELAFPGKLWEKIWFSSITITNLRVLLSGCIECCKYVLQDPSINHDIVYLPMLAFNQSNLEAQFSHLRRLNMDNPHTYGASVNRMSEYTTTNITLRNNKCYDKNDVGDTSRMKPLSSYRTTIKKILTVSSCRYEKFISYIPNHENTSRTRYFSEKTEFKTNDEKLIYFVVGNELFYGNFNLLFIEHSMTKQFIECASKEEIMETFIAIVSITSSDILDFDMVCQKSLISCYPLL